MTRALCTTLACMFGGFVVATSFAFYISYEPSHGGFAALLAASMFWGGCPGIVIGGFLGLLAGLTSWMFSSKKSSG